MRRLRPELAGRRGGACRRSTKAFTRKPHKHTSKHAHTPPESLRAWLTWVQAGMARAAAAAANLQVHACVTSLPSGSPIRLGKSDLPSFYGSSPCEGQKRRHVISRQTRAYFKRSRVAARACCVCVWVWCVCVCVCVCYYCADQCEKAAFGITNGFGVGRFDGAGQNSLSALPTVTAKLHPMLTMRMQPSSGTCCCAVIGPGANGGGRLIPGGFVRIQDFGACGGQIGDHGGTDGGGNVWTWSVLPHKRVSDPLFSNTLEHPFTCTNSITQQHTLGHSVAASTLASYIPRLALAPVATLLKRTSARLSFRFKTGPSTLSRRSHVDCSSIRCGAPGRPRVRTARSSRIGHPVEEDGSRLHPRR